jgi:hypothetical protein
MLVALTAAVYRYTWHIFHALHSGTQALFEGFWLGILPDSVIDMVSERSYGGGGSYINETYLDSGLYFWEEIAIKQFFPPGASVLVGSAGGGRELIGLVRAGYTVLGFECCRAMVAAGRQSLSTRGIGARLEWAPPCHIPTLPPDEIWDAAIVGWNGYTYMSPRSRRIAFLKSLRGRLKPGAPVLVSCAIRTGRSRLLIWTPRIANAVRALTFRPRAFTTGTRFPGLPRHEFTKQELEAELIEAGLEPAAFWRWGPFGAAVARLPIPC